MLLFACMNLWKERENMCEMFGLLSSFSPGLPWQGTVGGRAWKSWRTTSTSATALPASTKPLAAQELWHISFNDQMWHDLCVKLVMNWEVLVPGGESADPQRVHEVRTSMKAGAALVFFLCFIRLLRDIFLENQVNVAWWKFRPLGDRVDYSFFSLSL